MHRDRLRRFVLNESRERTNVLIANEIRHSVHIAGHGRTIGCSEARCHLDVGVAYERTQHGRFDLAEILMGEHDADVLLSRLGQDHLNLRIVADVVVTLIHIDETGEARFDG